MTAKIIIEEIKQLSPEDREQVTRFIQSLSPNTGATQAQGVSPEGKQAFEQATDRVFEKHGELLRRLAK